MESADYHSAAAMLAWQIELGADETICDQPLNRYELPAALAKPAKAAVANDPKARPTPPPAYEVPKVDGAAIARDLADAARDTFGQLAEDAGFFLEHVQLADHLLELGDVEHAVPVHVELAHELRRPLRRHVDLEELFQALLDLVGVDAAAARSASCCVW